MVSIRMTEAQHAYEIHKRQYVERRAPPHREDALRWAEFCATIESRIRAVRAEAGDLICTACGSTTPNVKTRKWCARCQQWFPVACFSRNRAQHDGLATACKPCSVNLIRAYRSKIAKMRRAG